MFKNIVPVVLLSGLSLTAGIAHSAEIAFPSNPEHSFSSQPAPSPLTRTEVRQETEAFRLSPVSPDGWRYVGGERAWERIQHGYSYSGGKLAEMRQRHYRPHMNVVKRPTLDSGKGYEITGHHEIMVPLLAWAVVERLERPR